MTISPLISVIIPTLNEDKYLPTVLQCLRGQDHPKIEIIMADNDSTDATRDLCRDFDLTLTDGGLPGEGRNAGAKIARGEYLLFLDADTYFAPDFVRSLLGRMI